MKRQDLRIIVEGMDGSGKSTLISRLIYEFPQLELVRNPLDDKQDFEKWWPQELDRQKSDRVPIHDRFFYSELIYGPVIRGKLSVGDVLINNVALFLRSHSLLIYTRPSVDSMIEAIHAQPQMEGVKAHFQDLVSMYDKLMMVEHKWYLDRFFAYNWQNPGGRDLVEATVRHYLNGTMQ